MYLTFNKYGEGELLGNKLPDTKTVKHPLPCIRITSGQNKGKIVWGFQVWWLSREKFDASYKGSISLIEDKEIDFELIPIKEEEETQKDE